MTTVTSIQEGFRRCGVAFSRTTTVYPEGTFTPEQLAILKAEPKLVVVETPEEPKTPPGKATAAELIDKIKAAATLDEVVAILGDDKRATVLAAAEARQAELT